MNPEINNKGFKIVDVEPTIMVDLTTNSTCPPIFFPVVQHDTN
jgi:hypothetical protein